MKIALERYNSRYISDLGIEVFRCKFFECPDDIAEKLLAHGDYCRFVEKSGGKTRRKRAEFGDLLRDCCKK